MKRAQAALEFLMTYGWAIMVLLIAIGALAYFGAFKTVLPERCKFSGDLYCQDAQIRSAQKDVNLSIINGMGQTIYNVRSAPDATSFTLPLGTYCSTPAV